MPARNRVLLVKFGAIGDVVMTLPAAHRLHEAGAEIDWICGPAVAPLLACYPWIRTIVADDAALLRSTSAAGRARETLGLWRRLAGRRYHLCATLYYDPRYRLLTLPVRADRRIALSREERSLSLIADRHHSDEFARILLGWPDSCRPVSLPPLPPAGWPVPPLPAKSADALRIGLVPGGASNMLRQQTLRRWPVESYAAVASDLLRRGFEVLLLGGPDDVSVRPHFAGMAVIDALGSLSLPEVVAACNTCEAVVSHDTGPMHLAGLSSAALLALFGPTSPGSFLPRRSGVRAIAGGEGFACRPCYDGRDFAPCQNNGCLQQITPEMVLGELESLLSERAGAVPTPWHVLQPSQTWKRQP